MTTRAILFALVSAMSAFGQLQWQLDQVDASGNETPICNSQVCNGIELGSTTAGTNLVSTFHLYNTSSSAADVSTLSVTGAGFSLVLLNTPEIPVTLLPEAPLDFQIVFSASSPGQASGSLAINSNGPYTVYASATAGSGQPNPPGGSNPAGDPVVVNAATGATVSAGGTIAFGSVQRGSNPTLTLLLEAPASASAVINAIAVTGSGFTGSGNIVPPVTLASGNSL